MKQWWMVAAGVATAVAVGGGGFWLGKQRNQDAPVAAPVASKAGGNAPQGTVVEVARVQAIKLAEGITAIGSLRSDESISIRPEVAGRISEILFREGQAVRAGDVLVRLDASIQRAEHQQAAANLALNKSRVDRARDLYAKNFISAQARDEAESNFQVAEASHALSAARLTKLEIKAPFPGLVGLRSVSVGDYIKDGQEIANLEGVDPLKLDFRIPEIYLKRVAVNQALEVTLDALPDKTIPGKVYAINPLIDAGGRAIVVRAVIRNTDARLRPGMFARVRLLTATLHESLTIPEQALIPSGDEVHVYKVVEGRAVKTRVETGQRQTGVVEVLRGLTAADTVVTAGQPKLRDGAPVKTKEPPAPNPAARVSPNAPPDQKS